MKKKIIYFLFFVLLLSLAGCGKKGTDTKELQNYKNAMSQFCDNLLIIDGEIKLINPESQDSIDKLFDEYDKLEEEFKSLSEIAIPKEYAITESLVSEAYDYMVQANDYMHQSFSETSYNPYTLEAANECFKRANKRVQYIISILHGELPQDDNITYK